MDPEEVAELRPPPWYRPMPPDPPEDETLDLDLELMLDARDLMLGPRFGVLEAAAAGGGGAGVGAAEEGLLMPFDETASGC